MAKSEQFIPSTEEQLEEKDRLSKGDKAHETFVPIEQVPDDALLPDQFEEREKITAEEIEQNHDDEEDDSDLEHAEPTREEKIAALQKEIKSGYSLFAQQKLADLLKQPAEKPLGYMRGDGVASVGPDVIEDVPDAVEAEIDPVLPGADELEDTGPLREKVSGITAETNRYMRRRRSNLKQMENLKTLTPSKKERSSRSWLSRLLNGEVKTTKMKKEEQHEALDEAVFSTPEDPFKYEDKNDKAA